MDIFRSAMRMNTCLALILSSSVFFGFTGGALAVPDLTGLSLPPGQVISGPVVRRNGTSVTSINTGSDANLYINSTAPTESFLPNAPAVAFITSVPTQYVRFYTQGVTNAVGSFIAGSNTVRGLTPEQVRDRLALPYQPDSLTIVQVPAGTCMLVGTAAPIMGNFAANPPAIPTAGPWGHGGVTQESLIGKNANAADCANAQFLSAANYMNQQLIGAFTLSYRPLAGPGNAGSVATALDLATAPALYTDMDGVYNNLDLLNVGNSAALRSALVQLDGEAYSDVATVEMIGTQMFQRVVHDQMRLQRGSSDLADSIAAESPNVESNSQQTDDAAWRPWLSGYGGGGGLTGNGDSHNLSYTMGGIAGGLGRRFSTALLGGAAFGYLHSNFNTSGLSGAGSIDSFSAETYASYAPGAWYLDGMLGYGYSAGTLSRNIIFTGVDRTASGTPNANQFHSSLETGYHFALDERTVATPLMAMQGIALSQNSFDESGAGAIDLNVRQQSNASARSMLGAELSHGLPLGQATPLLLTLRVGWGHDFADVTRTITASFTGLPGATFKTNGAVQPRDQGLVSFGASMAIRSMNLFLRYDGVLAGAMSTHVGTAGLRIAF